MNTQQSRFSFLLTIAPRTSWQISGNSKKSPIFGLTVTYGNSKKVQAQKERKNMNESNNAFSKIKKKQERSRESIARFNCHNYTVYYKYCIRIGSGNMSVGRVSRFDTSSERTLMIVHKDRRGWVWNRIAPFRARCPPLHAHSRS